MKKAIIVIGTHGIGKSATIREYLKPMLGISKNHKKFILNNKKGFILSQSFEEGKREPENMVDKYCHYTYLVLAGRPIHEKGSLTETTKEKLIKENYNVKIVEITESNKKHYEEKATVIFDYLNK